MRQRPPPSLTKRLTLLFAASATLALLLMGAVTAVLVDRHFDELDTESLRGNLAFLTDTVARLRDPREIADLREQLASAFAGQPALSVALLDPDGGVIVSWGALDVGTMLRDNRIVAPGHSTTLVAPSGHLLRVLTQQARTQGEGAAPLLAAAATDMSMHEKFGHSFQAALWSLVVITTLLAGVLGWISARRGLMPLQRMRRNAAAITADRLDRRLDSASIPEELAVVVDTLNAMLARLQESFERLSGFSSDLAHELRTPVANLLTQTQVALSRARTPEQYRDVLASNGEELERLGRTISDMLFLAKAENALAVPARESVDLYRQAREVLDFYDALAAEKDVRLTLAGAGTVIGDTLMLRRAISNLLSNAIRHTPPGGSVTVQIDGDGAAAVTLSVENTGEPIPPEHLTKVFDRFYRVSDSRSRAYEGSGLGLAITRSIALAHGGTVAAESRGGLTRFALTLPRGVVEDMDAASRTGSLLKAASHG